MTGGGIYLESITPGRVSESRVLLFRRCARRSPSSARSLIVDRRLKARLDYLRICLAESADCVSVTYVCTPRATLAGKSIKMRSRVHSNDAGIERIVILRRGQFALSGREYRRAKDPFSPPPLRSTNTRLIKLIRAQVYLPFSLVRARHFLGEFRNGEHV